MLPLVNWQVLNDLLTSPLNPPTVIDPEINESRVKEINEAAVVRSERLLHGPMAEQRPVSLPQELETRRQHAMKEIARVGSMMAAKKKAGIHRRGQRRLYRYLPQLVNGEYSRVFVSVKRLHKSPLTRIFVENMG